jgi:hypothetical protein
MHGDSLLHFTASNQWSSAKATEDENNLLLAVAAVGAAKRDAHPLFAHLGA